MEKAYIPGNDSCHRAFDLTTAISLGHSSLGLLRRVMVAHNWTFFDREVNLDLPTSHCPRMIFRPSERLGGRLSCRPVLRPVVLPGDMDFLLAGRATFDVEM